MSGDVIYDIYHSLRHEGQTGVQGSGNDHKCWRFDAHGDNVGVERSMSHSKGVLDVSSMVNESGNDQHCEYDIDKSWEWKEHRFGIRKEHWVGVKWIVGPVSESYDQRRNTEC